MVLETEMMMDHSVLTQPREGSSASTLGPGLHLWGSIDDESRRSSEVYTTAEGKWRQGHMVSEDAYMSCTANINQTHFAITGGRTNPGYVIIATEEAEVKRVKMDPFLPVWGHSCVAFQNKIILAGGFREPVYATSNQDSLELSAATMILDLGTFEWTTVDMNIARAAFGQLIVMDSFVWAFGGLTTALPPTTTTPITALPTESLSKMAQYAPPLRCVGCTRWVIVFRYNP